MACKQTVIGDVEVQAVALLYGGARDYVFRRHTGATAEEAVRAAAADADALLEAGETRPGSVQLRVYLDCTLHRSATRPGQDTLLYMTDDPGMIEMLEEMPPEVLADWLMENGQELPF